MDNHDLPRKNPLSLQLDLSKFSPESFIPATEEEKRQQDVMSKSTTFFKDGMRKLFKNPLAVISLVLLAIILLTIIFAPMVVPYRYEEILSVNGKRDKGAKNLAPFTYSQMEQEYIEQGGPLAGVRVLADDILSVTLNHEFLPFFYEMGLLSCVPYPISVIAPGVTVRDDGNGVYLSNIDETIAEPLFTGELLKSTLEGLGVSFCELGDSSLRDIGGIVPLKQRKE